MNIGHLENVFSLYDSWPAEGSYSPKTPVSFIVEYPNLDTLGFDDWGSFDNFVTFLRDHAGEFNSCAESLTVGQDYSFKYKAGWDSEEPLPYSYSVLVRDGSVHLEFKCTLKCEDEDDAEEYEYEFWSYFYDVYAPGFTALQMWIAENTGLAVGSQTWTLKGFNLPDFLEDEDLQTARPSVPSLPLGIVSWEDALYAMEHSTDNKPLSLEGIIPGTLWGNFVILKFLDNDLSNRYGWTTMDCPVCQGQQCRNCINISLRGLLNEYSAELGVPLELSFSEGSFLQEKLIAHLDQSDFYVAKYFN